MSISRKMMRSFSFSPSDLFQSSEQGLWIDTFDSNNRVMSGDRVTTLYDLSGNSNDLVRANPSFGPFISTVSGLDYIDIGSFTARCMANNGSWSSSFNNQITFCGVIIPGSATAAGNSFWAPNITLVEMRQDIIIGAHVPFSVGKGSSKPWVGVTSDYIPGSEWLNDGTTLSTDTIQVFSFVIDGNDVSTYLGTSLDASTTFTVPDLERSMSTNQQFTLGCRRIDNGTLSDPWDNKIGSFILIDRVLSSGELLSIQNYFSDLVS